MTEPMIIAARLDAPIARVRQALTDPAELRVWLAEHAEVELPHRYEFWGRYTPEGDAPHQRLLHVDDERLRFAWLLDGVETTTEITLRPDGPDATVLKLSQTHFDFNDVINGTSIRGVLQTYWSLAIANLEAHLTGDPLLPKTDFTGTDFRGEMVIAAPADKVWESLTDSEQASAWFGYPIGIEPWTGGRYAMGGFEHGFAAKVVDLEPGRRMSVDWGAPGVTTWELAESEGKTKLTFVQSGFDEQNPPYAAWSGSVSGLGELRRFHEMPNWQPIWLPEESTVG
ncbi:SRPBCC domain-containing protein [Micromonospora sp. NPDC049900]|uniref:SRPBCC family protein n=1 Tax=unclassified Micromonospora TaxID=2617518 RepID=UPI0037ADE93E